MTIHTQHKGQTTAKDSGPTRRWFRKAYLLPAEHGSWSWLLVPYLVGVAVAPQWSFASLLVLIGGLSVFLIRQPATAWLRIKQGRGRRSDEPVTLAWSALFLGLATVSFIVLLMMQRLVLVWLLPPVSALLMVYVAVARINRARVRSMWMEIAGAAGLAVMAPAAYAAGSGRLDTSAWLLWFLMAMQNILGVFYVRLRIADRHSRPESRMPVLLSHALGLLLVALALAVTSAPLPALLPFAFFLGRACWLAANRRPVENIKRFGFMEVGVELAAGIWLILSFLLF
ncbi:MAG: YwiC-like family protein [Chloroflexota bacterium]